jgi:methylase of polypeptide subunit release factors
MDKEISIKERGDFQTPRSLSDAVCNLLLKNGVHPLSILEPTCGKGNFLLSALERFPTATTVVGMDINAMYVEQLRERVAQRRIASESKVKIEQRNFFRVDWGDVIQDLPEPILLIGNPPWITAAELSKLGSSNLPQKTNLWSDSGFDALMGKSNFDISEWILIHLLEQMQGRETVLAMLCKTNAARKVLLYAWENDIQLLHSSLYRFNAMEAFDVSVDASLLLCKTARQQSCRVYNSLSEEMPSTTFGFRDGHLVSDARSYDRWCYLQGNEYYRWRSGVKHDCAKVMELEKDSNSYRNKLGESYTLERTYLYPMLKSSDVVHGDVRVPTKWMLVTQCRIGESTQPIRDRAPQTWAYLQDHSLYLDARKSSVYKNRPRFSIFGVGEYTFAPWKVAIAGLYKKLQFTVVGSYEGKPIVLDDTCYFIPCRCREEAEYVANLLNSEIAKQFYEAFIFWDKKRPVTASILRRLDLLALAEELASGDKMRSFLELSEVIENELQQMTLGISSEEL